MRAYGTKRTYRLTLKGAVMARKQVGSGAAYEDEIVGKPTGRRGFPSEAVLMARAIEQARRHDRRERMNRSAPLGFAPKGEETRPRTR